MHFFCALVCHSRITHANMALTKGTQRKQPGPRHFWIRGRRHKEYTKFCRRCYDYRLCQIPCAGTSRNSAWRGQVRAPTWRFGAGIYRTMASDLNGTSQDQANLSVGGLVIALDHGSGGVQWFASMRNLHMVCLDLCVAWRKLALSNVVVVHNTPRHMWLRHEQESFTKKHCDSRIPVFKPRSMLWYLPASLISEGSALVHQQRSFPGSTIRWLLPSWERSKAVTIAWWPDSLREITFDFSFDDSVRDIVWPCSLTALVFGPSFNESMQGVRWPASIEHLTFGCSFNRAIKGIMWPSELTHLKFGYMFDLPIEGVVWPTALRSLTFGYRFNQRIQGVAWPSSLQNLTFGDCFNKPIGGRVGGNVQEAIDRVVWPASLRCLAFGASFNQPMNGVEWPASLHTLTLAVGHDQTFGAVVSAPFSMNLTCGYTCSHLIEHAAVTASLQHLSFFCHFNNPIDNIVWPSSLLSVTFGYHFNQSISQVVWPATLENISFGFQFNQAIIQVVWPASLKHLEFSVCFLQSIEGVKWPSSLESLRLGHRFNQPIGGAVWPASLKILDFGYLFNQPIQDVLWPDSLEWLRVGDTFNQPVRSDTWPSSLRLVRGEPHSTYSTPSWTQAADDSEETSFENMWIYWGVRLGMFMIIWWCGPR